MAYIGHTKRSMNDRVKQHLSKFKNQHYDESAVAQHMHDTGHDIDISCAELLEHVSDSRRLDCTESIFIQRFSELDVLLNRDNGPLESTLIKFVA